MQRDLLAAQRIFRRGEQRRVARCDDGQAELIRARRRGGPHDAVEREAAREAIALKRRTLDDSGRLSMALRDPRFAAFFADAAFEDGFKSILRRLATISITSRVMVSPSFITSRAERGGGSLKVRNGT